MQCGEHKAESATGVGDPVVLGQGVSTMWSRVDVLNNKYKVEYNKSCSYKMKHHYM